MYSIAADGYEEKNKSVVLTPPVFPEDGSKAVLVVVPSAVEINFTGESPLEHLVQQETGNVC